MLGLDVRGAGQDRSPKRRPTGHETTTASRSVAQSSAEDSFLASCARHTNTLDVGNQAALSDSV